MLLENKSVGALRHFAQKLHERIALVVRRIVVAYEMDDHQAVFDLHALHTQPHGLPPQADHIEQLGSGPGQRTEAVDQLVGQHHAIHPPERVVRGEEVTAFGIEFFEPFDRIGHLPFAETGADELLRRQVPVMLEDVIDFRLMDRTAEPAEDEPGKRNAVYAPCQPASPVTEANAFVAS